MLQGSADDTLCIFLISGGASAMMELPLDPAISLDDTVAFHRALVGSGATIVEMNCVRKHFSAVKGGRLAVAAGRAQKISLLVSDVPPAHLDALASGPTIPDPTTIAQCREILTRYQMLDRFPPSVRRFFESPELPETPKPNEVDSPIWKLVDSEELGFAAHEPRRRPRLPGRLRQHLRRLGLRRSRGLPAQPPARTPPRTPPRLPDLLRRSSGAAPRIGRRRRPQPAPRPLPRNPARRQRRPHRNSLRRLRRHRWQQPRSGRRPRRLTPSTPLPAAPKHSARWTAFDTYPFLNAIGATIVTGPTGHNLRDLRILLADSPS